MSETKLLPVPEGLAGERVDAGLAKLLGLSRSVCADMIIEGLVAQNGKVVSKSDRLMNV
jgi:23S rRNA pseudouridine1911/1915/1917 synthase